MGITLLKDQLCLFAAFLVKVSACAEVEWGNRNTYVRKLLPTQHPPTSQPTVTSPRTLRQSRIRSSVKRWPRTRVEKPIRIRAVR